MAKRTAGVASASTRPSQAVELVAARDVPNFDLGPERADVRGWQVFSSDARLVGMVERLIVDASLTIRYLAVALTPELANQTGMAALHGIVLIPVGAARALGSRRAVALDSLTSWQVGTAPRVTLGAVGRQQEDATLSAFGMATSKELPGPDLYGSVNFDERRLFASLALGAAPS